MRDVLFVSSRLVKVLGLATRFLSVPSIYITALIVCFWTPCAFCECDGIMYQQALVSSFSSQSE